MGPPLPVEAPLHNMYYFTHFYQKPYKREDPQAAISDNILLSLPSAPLCRCEVADLCATGAWGSHFEAILSVPHIGRRYFLGLPLAGREVAAASIPDEK